MIIRTTLKEQAYVHLKEAILNGTIKNDVMYSEQWCADLLNISRTPVREALLQMKNEDIIEIYSNKGVMLRPITEQEVTEIMQMRTAIEGYCCIHLVQHIHDPLARELIVNLEKIIENMSRMHDIGNYTEYIKRDLQFHTEIIEFSRSQKFMQATEKMYFRMEQFSFEVIASRSERAIEEHTSILNAIKKGDPTEAYAACMDHLEKIRIKMLECIDQEKQ